MRALGQLQALALRLEDGRYFEGDGATNAQYPYFGTDVLSVAAGEVVALRDGMAESTPLQPPTTVKTPEDYAGNVMGDLSSRRGMVQGMDDMPGGGKAIKAEVPLSEMFGYSTTLRSMSQGRATYTMEFKHYSEAPKNVADAIITARGK